MSETPTAGTAPEATPAEPQAGKDDQTAKPNGQAPDDKSGLDEATIRKELEAVRREAASYRTKLKTFEDAQKTEAERAAERIAELEKSNAELLAARREDTLKLVAAATARKLGFRNPDLAYRLVAGQVDFDESGTPTNVAKLLEETVKADPYLVATPSDFGGGPRGKDLGRNDMNTAIRRAAGRR